MIPYSTDAPIYHFPVGTLGIIALNVIGSFATAFGTNETFELMLLKYGELNPLQWITSIFAHGGASHLIGNMFFLWVFGLIVEGKIGWKRFIPLYLAIGVGQSGLEQTMMLYRTESWALAQYGAESVDELADRIQGGQLDDLLWPMEGADLDPEDCQQIAHELAEERGGSCGASAAIYGILAIALFWAPLNEINVLFGMFFFRVITFEVSVLWFAGGYLALQGFVFLLTGFSIGSAALHLMGAAIGGVYGYTALKKDWVDCENWDLLAWLSGTHGRFGDKTTTVGSHADPTLMFGKEVRVSDDVHEEMAPERQAASRKKREGAALREIARLTDAGQFLDANDRLFELRMHDPEAVLSEQRMKRLSIGLLQSGAHDDAELLLEEFTARFPENADWAHLTLAKLYVTTSTRPAAALQCLKKVRLSALPKKQQDDARQVARKAKQMVASGVKDEEHQW